MERSLNDDKAKEGVIYYDDRLALIDNISNPKMQKRQEVIKVNVFISLLCLRGSVSISINGEKKTLKKNELLICRPNIIIGNSEPDTNVEFRGICLSPEYIKQMTLISRSTWNAQQFFEKNPILSLRPEEVTLFNQYYDLLRSKLTNAACKHGREVTDALLRAFMYEFHDVLERFIEIKPHGYTSAENLFFAFTELIASSYPKSRSVAWYADKLHITPKYLSAICKETSEHTASEIINQYVVTDIKQLLNRTDMSIKEVSNELDFPNLSFFGKYVKRYFGCSPREYRDKLSQKFE